MGVSALNVLAKFNCLSNRRKPSPRHVCRAYDGWPAKTADGLVALGMTDAAVALFDRILPAVIAEGPLGQSHRVYNNSLLPLLLTAKGTTDQQYYASVSAALGVSVMRLAGLLPPLLF